MRGGGYSWLWPVLFFAGLIVLWQAACDLLAIPPFILPSPALIGDKIVTLFDRLLFHAAQTLMEVMVGFALASPARILAAVPSD